MLSDPLFLPAAIAAVLVAIVLLLGIGTFVKGGEFNRRHGNQLMRWRIIAQFVAVVLIIGFAWLRSRGGN